LQKFSIKDNGCFPVSEPVKHKVLMECGSFTALFDYLSSTKSNNYFLIGDFNTGNLCLPLIGKQIKPYLIGNPLLFEAGESSKCIEYAQHIWSSLINKNAHRNTTIINLGGGMICDMGAFAASVFKRGIPYINIPTSLMAMVDAAIGGKSAINFEHYKNQIGSFHFPELVYINTEFLKTLPISEILSGFGEILKYALIANSEMWNSIKKLESINDLEKKYDEIISFCVNYKIDITSKDPNEQNIRKILNAGHTIGHAIESLFIQKNQTISHGHAIAYGLIVESYLATHLIGLSNANYEEIKTVILKFFKKITLDNSDIKPMVRYLIADKKNVGSQIGFTLIQSIGEAKINCFCTEEILNKLIIQYLYEEN